MNALLLACVLATVGSKPIASDAKTAFIQLRLDAKGRIQVLIDGDDKTHYDGYLFQPASEVPPLPSKPLLATITKRSGRLTVDAEDPPLHLELCLGVCPERAESSATVPSIAIRGLALRTLVVPRDAGRIDTITTDAIAPMLGETTPEGVACANGRVQRDVQCNVGGPGALWGPGFNCPGRRPVSPEISWGDAAGEAGTLECPDDSYACGYCSSPPLVGIAHQECRPYSCPKAKAPAAPR